MPKAPLAPPKYLTTIQMPAVLDAQGQFLPRADDTWCVLRSVNGDFSIQGWCACCMGACGKSSRECEKMTEVKEKERAGRGKGSIYGAPPPREILSPSKMAAAAAASVRMRGAARAAGKADFCSVFANLGRCNRGDECPFFHARRADFVNAE